MACSSNRCSYTCCTSMLSATCLLVCPHFTGFILKFSDDIYRYLARYSADGIAIFRPFSVLVDEFLKLCNWHPFFLSGPKSIKCLYKSIKIWFVWSWIISSQWLHGLFPDIILFHIHTCTIRIAHDIHCTWGILWCHWNVVENT